MDVGKGVAVLDPARQAMGDQTLRRDSLLDRAQILIAMTSA